MEEDQYTLLRCAPILKKHDQAIQSYGGGKVTILCVILPGLQAKLKPEPVAQEKENKAKEKEFMKMTTQIRMLSVSASFAFPYLSFCKMLTLALC